MKKSLRISLLGMALATASLASAAPEELFFDDFDSYVSEQRPTGYAFDITGSMKAYTFIAYTGAWSGMGSHSGDNILYVTNSSDFNRDDVVFTPMVDVKAGEPCTISFYIRTLDSGSSRPNCFTIKAGQGQDRTSQTETVLEIKSQDYADWTEVTGTFVPGVSGKWCFSIQVTCALSNSSYVGIDDLCIIGTPYVEGGENPNPATELEPNPDNAESCVALPYKESFENENNNYDGTTYVPGGWKATGTNAIVTGSFSDRAPHTGDYNLCGLSSTAELDENLYTPFFNLEAGTTYNMSYWLYLPGQYNGTLERYHTTDVIFTAGTEQEADFHVALTEITDTHHTDWAKYTAAFTPVQSGPYCFSWQFRSKDLIAGDFGLDDFEITAEGLIFKPRARFAVNHIYDVMTSSAAVFPFQTVQLVNNSEYAESYSWSVTPEASISDANAETPAISFPRSGSYTVSLTASNAKGEHTTRRTIDVEYFGDKTGTAAISSNAPADHPVMRTEIPYFGASEEERDYVTGPNHYYLTYGHRMAFPDSARVAIQSVQLMKTACQYKTKDQSREEQFAVPFDIWFYGETDGRPDETKVYGHKSMTLRDAFGSTGIGVGQGEPMQIDFGNGEVTVQGPVYVVFRVGEEVDMEITDPNIGRTYMSIGALKADSGVTNLWVKPNNAPADSEIKIDEWTTLDSFDSGLKGLGLWMTLWGQYENIGKESGIVITTADSTPFSVIARDGKITVSGTHAGDEVQVTDMTGRTVASVRASGAITELEGIAHGGIYVVSSGSNSCKIVIR